MVAPARAASRMGVMCRDVTLIRDNIVTVTVTVIVAWTTWALGGSERL